VPFPRSSGLLLHPTSLPGPYGIGALGASAHAFIDFLARAGQRIWQLLPLGPTGYGDSPYQSFSAFAGNPLLIDLDRLVAQDWLAPDRLEADVATLTASPVDAVDYARVIAHRRALWPSALERFERMASPETRARLDAFHAAHAAWLPEYTLFMALKEAHDQVAWTHWEPAIARRDPDAVDRWTRRLAREMRIHAFTQFLFFEQWQDVRARCDARGISLMGDVPIFVAHDSADVWANRHLFNLRADGTPAVVAGVPPDYFSLTGQLWGNPHYQWDVMARDGYAWWIARIRSALSLVHVIRLDHFRGFDAAWQVSGDADTAMNGEWVPGPGETFFDALRQALGPLPFVAENLGVITPHVEALRHRYDLPGMAILQFAFGNDPQAPSFKPHNHERNLVVYTGTHDNDTTVGWWTGDAGHSTRSADDIARERAFASRYLGTDGREIHWDLIRTALASVAHTAIAPVQDLLGLGSEARMNRPGDPSGNWRWRARADALTPAIADRLATLTRTFDR